jgi:tRNA pseudouridine55 synthase
MQGILLVDKPSGWTSFDVVNYVRKIVAQAEGKKPRNVKVGHTGTLDPLATGLLVVLVGKEYTRRAGELSKQDKTYEVTMKLGFTSTTGDEEGEKTAVSDTVPSEKAVQQALEQLQGQIMQVPPVYSAMKINGQRAYKLAREGKTVELEARPATVYSNQFHDYTYPIVQFASRVGSGTYIRSLVSDLGQILGVGAYMTGLQRTEVGPYRLDAALSIDEVHLEQMTDSLIRL